ncbi:NUDIX domain-containing protein [Mucilaginibacter sp. CSA2-8R]|uniref:NUDIX domain-containing protein n=1 Tax=Mucilaginibacter sp. CSA2-8R TaxID=3141542 RepID=UPI00315D324C
MSTIQILNRETLSDKKYPLKNFTYLKPDAEGNMKEQKTEVYYRPDAAAILLYDKEKQKLLLTKQFRLPTYLNGNESGYLTEACAGLIDDGETPEQTVIREAKEELGVDISNIDKVGAVYTSGGGITEYLHLFIAAYDSLAFKPTMGGLAAEGEIIEPFELNFAEAKTKLKNGELNDAKTVMLLQYYFLFC